ncbi:MAG: hypothetical protein FWC12_05920 [Treponema sp.]|nr:hypothetical protein [Treponema sp.]
MKKLLFIAIAAIVLLNTACDILGSENNFLGSTKPNVIVEPTEGKLTITGMDNYNGLYVIAFGFNWNYEHLYAAEKIDNYFVFTGNKVKENQVVLNVWHEKTEKTLEDYTGQGKFTFLVYVIKKSEFQKPEEFLIGDYMYKGKPKPWWLETVGLIRGTSDIDGVCEAVYAEY